MKRDLSLYRKLFFSTLYLSAFTFGGGYVIISLMQKKFVDELKWLEEEEMLNMAAISQSSPGAIAVNAAILLGFRVAGIIGAIISILGTIIPPLVIISIISYFYIAFRSNTIVSAVLKGMQAGVTAVVVDVVIRLGSNVLKERDFVYIFIMIAAFIATYFLKVNVIFIILVCGVVGAIKAIRAGQEEAK